MPQITNLTCSPTQGDDPVSLSVACDLSFDPGEDGKPFQVRIEIVDDESSILFGPTVLYTFHFGRFTLLDRPYKSITGSVAGVHIAETRTFPRTRLDEDPGFIVVPGTHPPLIFPEKDEFRARVTVSQVTEAYSAIQTIYA